MKSVPAVYLPDTDLTIRVGDLIVWGNSKGPAGIAGNHDTLKITGIQTYKRDSATVICLDWECIDCGDTSGWTGKRATLSHCIRKPTLLEHKRIMKDIGEPK